GVVLHLEEVFRAEFFEGEELIDFHEAGTGAAGGDLGGEVASFEADEARGGSGGRFFEEGTGPCPEVFERGNGARDGQVKFPVFDLFGTDVACRDIGEADGFFDGVHDFEFFADAVHEMKAGVGEKNGQGDAGEAAAGAYIDHVHAGVESKRCGDGQGMQDMFFI